MTVTQKAVPSSEDLEAMQRAAAQQAQFDAAREDQRAPYRDLCLLMVDRYSMRAVEEATGLSTSTLQKWKKKATGK